MSRLRKRFNSEMIQSQNGVSSGSIAAVAAVIQRYWETTESPCTRRTYQSAGVITRQVTENIN